jgi:hypothetical protein
MQEKHVITLFFPLALVIFLVKKKNWKGNLALDISTKLIILTKYFPQIELLLFFTIKDQGLEGILFVAHFFW